MNRIVVVGCSVAAVVLGACAASTTKTASAPTPMAKASPAPSPAPAALTLATAGVNPQWMDPSADPCQDFYAYACGGFVKNTVIPGDMATWGPTEEVTKGNEEFLRDMLEKAGQSPTSPVEKKIGDYYAACMNEPAIEKAGLAPIQPMLDEIAKVKDFKTLATAVTALHKSSVFPLFDISAQQDFKDATKMIAFVDQDGLGLPDRDYYLKDEGNQKAVREFYRGHVGRMLARAAKP